MGKHHRSSDSEEIVGYSDTSSEEPEPPKKKKERKVKPKPEPPAPTPAPIPPVAEQAPPPSKRKLTKAERQNIVKRFLEEGFENPEYRVIKLANGTHRVLARKEGYKSPKAKVSGGSTTNAEGKKMNLSWINTQKEVNDELKEELKILREKYEKLSERDREPAPIDTEALIDAYRRIEAEQEKILEEPPVEQPAQGLKSKALLRQYKRPRINVRDF
jgi:RNA recognition motif-containing protein